MDRIPEPEYMDLAHEAVAYAEADFADVNQAFVDRLLELADGLPAATAADLGTGPADIPIRLARARPDWRICAVDAAPAMLEIARSDIAAAHVDDRVQVLCCDVKHLDLPDASYDAVFSNSILHHITDTAPFWAELKRIAAPGALVFLRDLYRPGSADAAAELVRRHAGGESKVLREEFRRSLLAAYTPDEVRAQLAEVGLEHLDVEAITDRHMDIHGRLA